MTKLGTDERLRRLLAAVPWIAANDGPTVDEVCKRFDYAEQELAEDLELLFMCGVYPFTADTLIEADIAEGRVWVRLPGYFARPLRLSPTEGLALVAAGTALLSTPGTDPNGPLARALAKLAAVLGVDPDEALEVELGEASPEVLSVLQQASTEQRQVEIEHYSYGRDEWITRTIDPHRVFSSAGAWYVWAWCHRAHDERIFRVDRVRAPRVLDETFTPRRDEPPPAVYRPDANDPLVVIEVTRDDDWVAQQYPNEGVEERRGGKLRVRLRGEPAFLERLLLRLGDRARVVSGDRALGVGAARRVLARYGR